MKWSRAHFQGYCENPVTSHEEWLCTTGKGCLSKGCSWESWCGSWGGWLWRHCTPVSITHLQDLDLGGVSGPDVETLQVGLKHPLCVTETPGSTWTPTTSLTQAAPLPGLPPSTHPLGFSFPELCPSETSQILLTASV